MLWKIKEQGNSQKVNHLVEVLNINHTLANLLVQRGIETFEEAKTFFRPSLDDLHNPFLMKGMDKAVDRVLSAIENQETIMVFGDYDVDGTTAVSLMATYLLSIYPNVVTYIPDRYKEGYGISFQGIDFAADNDIPLIIALDCGIKSIAHIDYATEKNIDFIICDHHRPGEEVPNAIAVLDPKQQDCNYPYKELCGCGVGFKLVQAIQTTIEKPIEDLWPLLDLVAVSIAADIVPINGENRVLAYYGLKILNQSARPGIKSLLGEVSKEITVTDLVFTVAPRINAAGRIKNGIHAVELLMEQDLAKAALFAKEIEIFNTERKVLDKQITEEAVAQLKNNNETEFAATVVYQEDWHKGVIGIVASRLIEQYYKPTLVFTKSGDYLAASARSVSGFDVYDALEACSDYIEQFGGHKYAAGLTIKPENYELFKAKFISVVKDTILDSQKEPTVLIDTEIDLNAIDDKFYRILCQLAPFGPANMKPVFKATNLESKYVSQVGADKSHLKLTICNAQKSINAIGFGLGNQKDFLEQSDTFEAAFTIEQNEWNNITSLQLMLKDIR